MSFLQNLHRYLRKKGNDVLKDWMRYLLDCFRLCKSLISLLEKIILKMNFSWKFLLEIRNSFFSFFNCWFIWIEFLSPKLSISSNTIECLHKFQIEPKRKERFLPELFLDWLLENQIFHVIVLWDHWHVHINLIGYQFHH
jgi:hypothetical protein